MVNQGEEGRLDHIKVEPIVADYGKTQQGLAFHKMETDHCIMCIMARQIQTSDFVRKYKKTPLEINMEASKEGLGRSLSVI